MNVEILARLLAVAAVLGRSAPALAADATEPEPTKGHATFSFRATCAANVTIKDAGGKGQDKLTVTFVETQEIELTRQPGSVSFRPELAASKSNVSVSGEGKYVNNDPRVPTQIWHYETDKQFEEHLGNWDQGMIGVPLPYNWFVCIGDFMGAGTTQAVKCVDNGEGAMPAAHMFATQALHEGAGTGLGGAWCEALGKKPYPLEWRFNLPPGMTKTRTYGTHRTYTGTTPQQDVTGSATISVDYEFHFIPPAYIEPEKPKVELQEIDRKLLPEEGNSVTATVSVTGDEPADAFRFTLYDVSKEPGTCCNSDDQNKDPDLSFAPGQPDWDVAALVALAPLVPGAGGGGGGEQCVATCDKEGKSATIQIACHDWGAWGKLKAQAKIKGEWEPAKVAGSGLDYVRIPYDDDDDHIADSWQADNGVADKAPTDDCDKAPTDQTNDGDGLSAYECYRGFNVLDAAGGLVHVRLDPRRKVLFVLDLSGYFEPGLWQQCSGITAYLVGQTGCRIKTWADAARLVNFRSSNAKNGDKFCVVVTPIPGYKKGDTALGSTEGKSGAIQAPRDVDSCRLFPDVADAWLQEYAQKLENAYEHPDSADGRDLGDPKLQPGPDGRPAPTNPVAALPPRMWKDAADRLKDPKTRQQLVAQCMRWTAIHEMGHACSLLGHYEKGDATAKEISVGNKTCPMCYSEHAQDLQYAVLQVLLKPEAAMPMSYGQFCRDADFNCWGHLNVKDN
jgi:hypothetical protein